MNASEFVSNAATDDAELVEAARSGVRSAMEALVRRYNQHLFRIARAQLGSDEDAEELTQQAWVQIVPALHLWSGKGSFAAWASTIVVNACRSRHRSAALLVNDEAEHDEALFNESQMTPPDEETHRLEVRKVLQHTIDELPPNLRVVLVMRDVEGFSGAEAATALGITEQAVRVRLHRARQTLQQSLDTKFQGEARELYPFLGARCDRMTAAVLAAFSLHDA